MGSKKIIECQLCPKYCRIAQGQSGECRIRMNIEGELKAVTYGYPCAVHMDPIEKKPLFHFYPGSRILSIATAGCNLHCKFCQNWEISQANPEDIEAYHLEPADLVVLAEKEGTRFIAYTYTDPAVYYEYALDTSRIAREAGMKNVLVTAGFLNEKPLAELYRAVDASNTDLKFFDNRMYEDICSGQLAPVLNGLVLAKEMGIWLEVTNLVIPTLNDDMKMIERMCKWFERNLGSDTPLHFSRFSPRYKIQNLPPTPVDTLVDARKVALDQGIKFVYIGNVLGSGFEDTVCPSCRKDLVRREGFSILENNIQNGKCRFCKEKISGVWE
jgi:pyruvate formate lyase activating enzyme